MAPQIDNNLNLFHSLDIMKHHEHQIYVHSIRVADLAVYIGKQCGLTAFELIDLHFSAIFHDVGKLGIPPAILYKQGKLEDQEWAIIKEHPYHGKKLLENNICVKNPNILRAIYYHHERYDGNGYPDNIKGESIPIHSRIIAVADAIEAMIAPRPYKEVLSLKNAMRELREFSGTQFDPYIVNKSVKWKESKLEKILYAPLVENYKFKEA